MRFPRACLLLFAGCLIAITGCKPEDEISVTTVTHPDREAIRLKVAAIKRDKVIWFIRMSGPVAEIAKQESAFDDFVRSAKFVEDKETKKEIVTFTEPKGWQKDDVPPGEMRFSNYRIGAKSKELEVTVTRLPASDQWLLVNVNRWQKQVNLPPATKMGELKPGEVKEENGITWVDLTGLGAHLVSRMPDAVAANAKKFQLPIVAKQPAAKKRVPFQYDVPPGWEKVDQPGQFAAERYAAGKDVQVTLTPVGGGVAANINRWRKDIGLPPIGEAEIERSLQAIEVAGVKSAYADIDNRAGPAKENRTLGVIMPTNWVIKMWGPRDQVGQQKNAFETFVKSFKLDAR